MVSLQLIVTVYSSITGPIGPYTKRSSLAAASSSTSSTSSMSYGGDQNFGSQQTDIFSYLDSSGVEQFMYVGDHWQSAPDGLKSHDFTVWAPLMFTTDGNVTTRGFESSFVVDVAKP